MQLHLVRDNNLRQFPCMRWWRICTVSPLVKHFMTQPVVNYSYSYIWAAHANTHFRLKPFILLYPDLVYFLSALSFLSCSIVTHLSTDYTNKVKYLLIKHTSKAWNNSKSIPVCLFTNIMYFFVLIIRFVCNLLALSLWCLNLQEEIETQRQQHDARVMSIRTEEKQKIDKMANDLDQKWRDALR